MKNAQKITGNGAQRETKPIPTEWQRIKAVVEMSGMSTNAFARHIGLLRGENLYQIKKGNNGISLDVAARICTLFPRIDKLWLLTGDGQMIKDDAPAGPWSNIGMPNSQAFRGWAAGIVLTKLLDKNCPDPYALAVEHAEKLQMALAMKGGAQ